MRDRIPAPGRENRIRITQDDGTVIAGKLEYDDQATQEGSPYTKGNVLPDEVCDAYGLNTTTAEPKDVFLAIPELMDKGLLIITVKKINGAYYQGVVIGGLPINDASRRTTDAGGKVMVYVNSGTYNLTFTPPIPCIDTTIPNKSVTINIGDKKTIETKETANGLTALDITSTRNVAFSANIQNLDVFCVGGGGAGGTTGGGSNSYSAGGGGGYTKTKKNVSFIPYRQYLAAIGAGGTASVSNPTGGGTTSLLNVSASGGKPGTDRKGGDGGSGGGGGGAISTPSGNGGSDGSDCANGWPGIESYAGGKGQGTTTKAFGETSGELFAGGGAGSGVPGTGGGGYPDSGSGTPNTGGGGGSAKTYDPVEVAGGNGGSGIIKLRWVNAS